MPINAVRERNDARAAAALLVLTARECLRNVGSAPAHVTELNNVYRLLESFRANQFFGQETTPSHYSDDSFSPSPPRELHVREVRDVLAAAIEDTFSGQQPSAAIGEITDTLRRVAYPERFGLPSADSTAKAANFFSKVADQL